MSVCLKALSALLGLSIAVVLARSMGPKDYGVYAFTISIMTVLALPSSVGLPQVVTRETSKTHAVSDWRGLKGLWKWGTRVALISAAVVCGAASIVLLLLRNEIDPARFQPLLLGLALIPMLVLNGLRSASLRGLGNVVLGQLPELAIRPSVLLALVLSLPLVVPGRDISPSVAVILNTSATAVSFVLGALLLLRSTPPETGTVPAEIRGREWMRAALPMAATGALHLVNTQADILMIGVFLENEDVGRYRVAVQAATLVIFALQATKMVVEPSFSRLFASGDLKRVQALARAASRLNASIGSLVFIALLLAGETLLRRAFGPEFDGASVPLLILATGWVFGSTVATSGHLLNMAGFEAHYARLRLIGAISNIVLNLILIPTLGIVGGAIATAISMITFYGLSWRSARRLTGCDCSPFGSLRPVEHHG